MTTMMIWPVVFVFLHSVFNIVAKSVWFRLRTNEPPPTHRRTHLRFSTAPEPPQKRQRKFDKRARTAADSRRKRPTTSSTHNRCDNSKKGHFQPFDGTREESASGQSQGQPQVRGVGCQQTNTTMDTQTTWRSSVAPTFHHLRNIKGERDDDAKHRGRLVLRERARLRNGTSVKIVTRTKSTHRHTHKARTNS